MTEGLNKSIWISSNNKLSVRTITETYKPNSSQVLVKVAYSGINPADIKHGLHLGLNDYPSGYEYSGEVIESGPGNRFSVGDQVLGHNLVSKNKPIYHGSHQDYLIGEHFVSKVPPHMPMQDAACISIMVQTAADALFNQLELPGGAVLDELPATEPLLIWGGSSGVGVAAIQLAKAAGVSHIFTTASKRNHEELLLLGATACFDYRDSEVVQQIKASAKERDTGTLNKIFDTVCSSGQESSISLCEECSGSENTKFAGTLPQPGNPKWKMVLATRNVDFPSPKPGGGMQLSIANPACQEKIDETLGWCLSHYGKGNGFVIPRVRVVSGADEGMKAMKFVAEGKSSLEKVAIKHPL